MIAWMRWRKGWKSAAMARVETTITTVACPSCPVNRCTSDWRTMTSKMTTASQTNVCTRYEKKTSRVKRKTNPETTKQGKSQRVHRGTNRPLGKREKTRKNTPLPRIFKTMARTCHGEELSCKTEVTFTVAIA